MDAWWGAFCTCEERESTGLGSGERVAWAGAWRCFREESSLDDLRLCSGV